MRAGLAGCPVTVEVDPDGLAVMTEAAGDLGDVAALPGERDGLPGVLLGDHPGRCSSAEAMSTGIDSSVALVMASVPSRTTWIAAARIRRSRLPIIPPVRPGRYGESCTRGPSRWRCSRRLPSSAAMNACHCSPRPNRASADHGEPPGDLLAAGAGQQPGPLDADSRVERHRQPLSEVLERVGRLGAVPGAEVDVVDLFPLVIPVSIVVPATRAEALTQRFANERLQMPTVDWRMTGVQLADKVLLHQVHYAKIAADVTASVVSDFLPWKARPKAALAVRVLLPVSVSLAVLGLADLDALATTARGRPGSRPVRTFARESAPARQRQFSGEGPSGRRADPYLGFATAASLSIAGGPG